MEGAQLIAQAMKRNDSIDDIVIVDETITIRGAQLLVNTLSSSQHCELALHDSFENYLSFTDGEQVEISFLNFAAETEEFGYYVSEILQ